MKVLGIIPARYHSTRLEGKPLADIHGKPLIQHVYERAQKATTLDGIVVATDDERIVDAVRRFDGSVVMTSVEHACGTERVAEVAADSDASIVVNIQGDEPLLAAQMIDECVNGLKEHENVTISTIVKRIGEEQFYDDAVVKVVRATSGQALYFSRSLLPYPRFRTDDFQVFEHIGLYAYTKESLVHFAQLPQTPLEKIEGLEQLRALESGIPIQTIETSCEDELVSVDTPQDLERVRQILANGERL